MSESWFTPGNQITDPEIAGGKPLTRLLVSKFKARDQELFSQMSVFGGPASTGAGSAISFEGDVTLSVNQNLSGLHYYNTLTINSGVVVTADKPLRIVARGRVDISGATITAVGYGAAGGLAGRPGLAGAAGGAGGPGGGAGAAEAGAGGHGGGAGGNGVNGTAGGLGGATPGVNGALGSQIAPFDVFSVVMQLDYLGLGGGGGGGGAHDINLVGGQPGGAGGGVIEILAPEVVCTGGTLTAAGAPGAAGAGNASGSAGGGGGVIRVITKSWVPPAVLSVAGGVGGVSAAQGDGAAGRPGVLQIDILA